MFILNWKSPTAETKKLHDYHIIATVFFFFIKLQWNLTWEQTLKWGFSLMAVFSYLSVERFRITVIKFKVI